MNMLRENIEQRGVIYSCQPINGGGGGGLIFQNLGVQRNLEEKMEQNLDQ